LTRDRKKENFLPRRSFQRASGLRVITRDSAENDEKRLRKGGNCKRKQDTARNARWGKERKENQDASMARHKKKISSGRKTGRQLSNNERKSPGVRKETVLG